MTLGNVLRSEKDEKEEEACLEWGIGVMTRAPDHLLT